MTRTCDLLVRSRARKLRIPDLEWKESIQAYEILEQPAEGEFIAWPSDDEGTERRWRWGLDAARRDLSQFKYQTDTNGNVTVYYRYRPAEGVTPTTTWIESKYSATEHGTGAIKDLFGASVFPYPKSVFAVSDCLSVSGIEEDGVVLDFFGGSGTTAQAVLSLNRADGLNRAYVLIEMDDHFESVLVPRIKKVVYGSEWKDGTPVSRTTGVSHAFKIVRLESYEDALNNLLLRRDDGHEHALSIAPESQRAEYMLGYFLDVETVGSPSLLDVARFKDPFSYQLQIATRTAGESKAVKVDLVETFNWLIGLRVKHIDHKKGFVMVAGTKRNGGRTLIVWRVLSEDPVSDNEALQKYLGRINVNPADTEFASIYVNGSHTLEDPHKKIYLIEEEFHQRMFESESFESLS